MNLKFNFPYGISFYLSLESWFAQAVVGEIWWEKKNREYHNALIKEGIRRFTEIHSIKYWIWNSHFPISYFFYLSLESWFIQAVVDEIWWGKKIYECYNALINEGYRRFTEIHFIKYWIWNSHFPISYFFYLSLESWFIQAVVDEIWWGKKIYECYNALINEGYRRFTEIHFIKYWIWNSHFPISYFFTSHFELVF